MQRTPISHKARQFTESVIREMTRLALEHGAVNLAQGFPDFPAPDVLKKAADEERVLVTHDRRTMPYHFAEFIPHRQSPGVFIIPQRVEIGAAIDELLLIWSASDSDEWTNRILYLPL